MHLIKIKFPSNITWKSFKKRENNKPELSIYVFKKVSELDDSVFLSSILHPKVCELRKSSYDFTI